MQWPPRIESSDESSDEDVDIPERVLTSHQICNKLNKGLKSLVEDLKKRQCDSSDAHRRLSLRDDTSEGMVLVYYTFTLLMFCK